MNVLYMDKLKALEHWLKKRDEYLVDIQKLHDEMNMGKLSENKLSAELEIKQQTLAQDTESLKAAQLEQEEKQSGYAEFLQSLQIESASTEQRLTPNDIKSVSYSKDWIRTRFYQKRREQPWNRCNWPFRV